MRTNPYKVVTIQCENGERLPILVSTTTSLPARSANRWILINRRSNNQTSTLQRELRTISFLYWWSNEMDIDLDRRLATGNGLSIEEINPSLYDWLRKDFTQRPKVQKITVASNTHRSRLETIREYILWRIDETLSRLNMEDPRFDRVKAKRDLIKDQFNRNLPHHRLNRRIGLEPTLRNFFLQVIQPSHPENAWNQPVRYRNHLLCMMFLTFGLRRGEALKIYLSDINLSGQRPTLTIRRRPDDINDPRINEPKVKTLGRIIPLDKSIAKILDEYILKQRAIIPNAKKCPFLFLASTNGKPLSNTTVNNIINQITKKHPCFHGALSPHILRHSYNDLLSELADQTNISENDATEIRNYLCGWTRNSTQGNNYRQRYIKQKSFDLSIKHQQNILMSEGKNNGTLENTK